MELEKFSVGSLDSIYYIASFVSSSEQDYFLRQVYIAPPSKWKSLKNRRLQNWGGVMHEKGLIAQSLPPWLTSLTQRISSETGLFPSPINHVLVNEYTPGQGIMAHQDGPLYFPVVAIVSLGSPTVMKFSPHQSIMVTKEGTPLTSSNQQDFPIGNLTKDVDGANHMTDHLEQVNAGVQKDHRNCRKLSTMEKCQKPMLPKHVSLILMPGSLLIFKDSAYEEYLHGIEDTVEHKVDETVVNSAMVMAGASSRNLPLQNERGALDSLQPFNLRRTGTRISLTCRLILKTHGKFLRL